MLQVSALQKSYGGTPLFTDVTFSLQRRERVGLIGRNGHGKSTLFRILLKQEEADGGEVIIPRGYRVGHLPQVISFSAASVIEEACLGLSEEERDQRWRAERILMGLGFSEADMLAPPESFSGGFQLRINLTKLLLSDPDLLLLDEPTNYLDIVSVRWLKTELTQWRGELIMISHDRDFMDSITSHTMMIHRGRIKKAAGSSHALQELIAIDEETYERTRAGQEKRREETQAFIDRFRAQASKASLVQSRVKELERMGTTDKLEEIRSLSFSFNAKEFASKTLLHVDGLSFGYTNDTPLFKNLSFTIKKGARIGIVGKNGRGKSTLLRLLAQELSPTTGEVRPHELMSLGYFGQTNVARLTERHTIEEEIQLAAPLLSRTAVRAICGSMMFSGDKAEKKIGVLSGGEKSRVLLGKLLATPCNLLMLDEPTSHLDIESVEALVAALNNFSGGLALVTHSEMILRALCDSLIVFRGGDVTWFPGTYDEFLDMHGWDEEEENRPSEGRKAGDVSKSSKGDKRPSNSNGINPIKRKKLEAEFEQLEVALSENAAAIEEYSAAREVEKVIELAHKREELERRQIEVLEVLEG